MDYRQSGRNDRPLSLWKTNHLYKQNDTLGILKNTALLEDVQTFCRVLTKIEWYYRTNDIKYLQDYPFDLIMGEMSSGLRTVHPSRAYVRDVSGVRLCIRRRKKFLDDELQILE